MTKIEDLKVFIVSIDQESINKVKEEFQGIDNVFVYHSDIIDFYEEHKDEIDCLVSPANAFGYMTGGYDAALSDILGWDFQYKVREYIFEHFYGEQPAGSSFIIPTNIPGLNLIHTPTMRYPSIIKDEMVVYHATRSTLITALINNVKCIVLPIFGGLCGAVSGDIASGLMKDEYLQIKIKKGPINDF